MKHHKIAIFASGNGSNAETIIERVGRHPNLEVVALISDQPKAYVLRRPFPVEVERRCFPIEKDTGLSYQERKRRQEMQVLEYLKARQAGWIFLGGYMRILGEEFLAEFNSNRDGRIINIHPSLLPAYPGLNSFQRAFDDKVSESGVTIHFVDEGIDTGPILLQKSFTRESDDSLETFEAKGRAIEKELYSKVVDLLASGELEQLDQKGIINGEADRTYI